VPGYCIYIVCTHIYTMYIYRYVCVCVYICILIKCVLICVHLYTNSICVHLIALEQNFSVVSILMLGQNVLKEGEFGNC
jgi:hypothetical protein